MTKTDRFNHTLVVGTRYATRHDNWSGNTIEATVEGKTEHYIILRSKGGSYSNRGDSHWVAGSVRVVEIRATSEKDTYAAKQHATWERESDRSWRTTVKAAVAAMHEAEAAWPEMNEARETREVAATHAAQERELAEQTAENATNVVANCKAMKTATASFFATIKEIEAEHGAKFTHEDIKNIMVIAMSRAA